MARQARHQEEGESYFASISDMMVGILFIFLLMLTVFALNFADDDKDAIIHQLTIERDEARTQLAKRDSELDQLQRELTLVKAAVEALTRERDEARALVARRDAELDQLGREMAQVKAALDALTQREAARGAAVAALIDRLGQIEQDISSESRRLEALRQQLLTQIQGNLRARNINVDISERHDVLRLPSEQVFLSGTATFTPRGHDQVVALLEELSRLLPCYAVTASPAQGCTAQTPIFETVLFEGHTDTVKFDNWRLSTDRARAVLDLVAGPLAGLAELRNGNGQPLLGLAGYGESRTLPGIAGDDPRNRRIELRFLLAPSREAELEALRSNLDQLKARLEALRAP